MSNVLLGPGATGIVGAVGGAMHAAKDINAANAAAICGWKRFMCSRLMARWRGELAATFRAGNNLPLGGVGLIHLFLLEQIRRDFPEWLQSNGCS
jgi:hypothetical protein